MAKETYKDARVRLHRELAPLGWALSRFTLTVLWAEKRMPQGVQRLWFKPQAVYLNSHTLDVDIRGMSARELQDHASRAAEIRNTPIRF
jgi:hypothetical protein